MLPFITIKMAMSLNGYLDEGLGERTLFSDAEDLEAVDILRAESDAILIGGGTARYDNPSLLIKSDKLISERLSSKRTKHPKRVVLWGKSEVLGFRKLNLFLQDDAETVVLFHESLREELNFSSPHIKTIFYKEDSLSPKEILKYLEAFNLKKILIEGGAKLIMSFLEAKVYNELRLAYAPVILNSDKAVFLKPNNSFEISKEAGIEQKSRMTVVKYS